MTSFSKPEIVLIIVIHVCVYVCRRSCVDVHACMCVYVCMYVSQRVSAWMWVRASWYVCVIICRICVRAHLCVSMYVRCEFLIPISFNSETNYERNSVPNDISNMTI